MKIKLESLEVLKLELKQFGDEETQLSRNMIDIKQEIFETPQHDTKSFALIEELLKMQRRMHQLSEASRATIADINKYSRRENIINSLIPNIKK